MWPTDCNPKITTDQLRRIIEFTEVSTSGSINHAEFNHQILVYKNIDDSYIVHSLSSKSHYVVLSLAVCSRIPLICLLLECCCCEAASTDPGNRKLAGCGYSPFWRSLRVQFLHPLLPRATWQCRTSISQFPLKLAHHDATYSIQ